MSIPSIDDLLDRWEDAKAAGTLLTPEDVCRDCPERLAELKRQIAALASVDDLLSVDPDGDSAPKSRSTTVPGPPGTAALGPTPAADRYGIVRRHAEGGLGEVLLARDRVLERQVALKRIRPARAGDSTVRQRFLREAAITGQLQHPGVVPIYDLITDAAGHSSYAMRFIEGESLEAAIRRFHEVYAGSGFRGIEFRTLLQRFVSVCNTIAYAHSESVIHRDLKPANVMLGSFGETLVVDWGLAKRLTAFDAGLSANTGSAGGSDNDLTTGAGTLIGTPAYMSPEQVDGRTHLVGQACDIFALGGILYALLTGRAPYEGCSGKARADSAQCPPPRDVNPRAPAALDAVCRKAMEARPKDRYATAKALAADVEHWLADEPVAAWHEPIWPRIRRWVRRHARLTTGVGAVLVAATIGLGILAIANEHSRAALAKKEEETARERDRARANYTALLWKLAEGN